MQLANYFVSLLCFVACCPLLLAQDIPLNNTATPEWSLQKCLNYARQNNLQLKQLELNKRSAVVNLKQGEDNRLPNVNGNFSHGVNWGRSIDPTTNAFSTQASQYSQLSVSSNVVLYNGLQLKNTIKQRKLEYELAQLQIDEAINNIDLNILAAYLQILLAEAQLVVLDKQATQTLQQHEQVNKLIKAGVLPAGDILNIEAQIANDNLNQVNAANAIEAAYLLLSQTLDYYEPIKIQKPKVFEPNEADLGALNATTIYQQALLVQAPIKTAEMRTKVAQQTLKVVEGAKLPTVTLGTSISSRYSSLSRDYSQAIIDTSYNFLDILFPLTQDTIPVGFPNVNANTDNVPRVPYFNQLWENLGGYIGLNVSIPIFNRNQVNHRIELSKINIENNRLAENLTKNTLRQNVEQAYRNTIAAYSKYEASKVNIDALRKALNYTEKKFKLGLVNTLEYVTARNNLTIAELNLESAKYEYYFRLKILDYYQGKSLNIEY